LYTLENAVEGERHMPLAIRNLLELDGLGLNLVAGERGLDRPIRWVHTSEW
jgi:hypothetical protein